MSKNRQFFALVLLPILLSGCMLHPTPKGTALPASCLQESAKHQEQKQALHECQQSQQTLQDEIDRLQAELEKARLAHQLLKKEHQELQEKVDALTDIERSLYERRLEQSE
ncbi:hypothetical protein SAMN05660443_2458 [Marinospirillum celere]|uniref:Uncharacterized protein n=1 Tax=Marinospirillum celere TaxID=1122252 RepID=A0A1I1IQU4_9GAMM|nr:hypothetical protein [Marinospirillum celere]SFC38604.1 hypothetical protein SAMN05660443_2458 [Marinospirillum celere]